MIAIQNLVKKAGAPSTGQPPPELINIVPSTSIPPQPAG